MIELKRVTKLYNTNGSIAIGIQNIDLQLYKNEIVVIVGDSGAGKTTLMNVITGIDTYEEGEMIIGGVDTSNFKKEEFDEFRNNNVGFVFQNYNLIESYSVIENVMAPLLARGFSLKNAKERAIEIIEKVGLSHRLNTRCNKLSGGEKQRTVIARALVVDSTILACDEPTGNLDSKTGSEIISLIKKVSQDKLVLIVTHDYEAFKDIATRKITVKDGQIVEDIQVKQIEQEPIGFIENRKNKQKLSTALFLSLKNIFSSPKRSFFSSFVFFIQFFVILLLILTVGNFNPTYESELDSYSNYTLRDDKVLVSYPKVNQKYQDIINKDAILLDDSSDLLTSAFSLTLVNYSDTKDPNFFVFKNKYFLRPYFANQEYELIEGDLNIQDDEIILAYANEKCKENNYNATLEQIINLTCNGMANDRFIYEKNDNYKTLEYPVKIKAVVYDPSLSSNYVIANEKTLKNIQNIYLNKIDRNYSFYSGYFTSYTELDTNLSKGGGYYNRVLEPYNSTLLEKYMKEKVFDSFVREDNTIYIDSSIDVEGFYIRYKNFEFDMSKYKIDNSHVLHMGTTYYYILPYTMVDDFFDSTYRIRTYYETSKEATKQLTLLNENSLLTESTLDKRTELKIVSDFNFLGSLFAIVSLLIILILSLLVGRVVLNLIYGSKKNDFVIMKTIGYNEQKIRMINLLEIILISLVVFVLDVVFLLVLINNYHLYEGSSIYRQPLFYILCLILILITSISFLRKFENKVFKKSIASTLKAGDYLD